MDSPPMTEATEIRRRGRQRLLGAIAIVAVLVVFVPMLLDSEPRKQSDGPALAIPPKADAPPLPAPPKADAKAAPEAAPAEPPKDAAKAPVKTAEVTKVAPPALQP